MTATLATANEPIVITQYQVLLDDIKEAQQTATPSFEYDSKEGNKAARSYIFQLRKLRGRIESERKDAKSYALAYGKRVDEQAKELMAQVDELILPHQEAIDAIARREAERVAALQFRLDRAVNLGEVGFDATSASIRERLDLLDMETLDGLEEFEEKVAAAVVKSRQALQAALAKAEQAEAEAAELARLRAEAQQREEADREAQRQRDAQAKADAEAQAAAADAIAEAEAKAAAAQAQAAAAAQAQADAERRAAEAEEQAKAAAAAQADADRRAALQRRIEEAAAVNAHANDEAVTRQTWQLLVSQLQEAMASMTRAQVAEAIADGRLHDAITINWGVMA